MPAPWTFSLNSAEFNTAIIYFQSNCLADILKKHFTCKWFLDMFGNSPLHWAGTHCWVKALLGEPGKNPFVPLELNTTLCCAFFKLNEELFSDLVDIVLAKFAKLHNSIKTISEFRSEETVDCFNS